MSGSLRAFLSYDPSYTYFSSPRIENANQVDRSLSPLPSSFCLAIYAAHPQTHLHLSVRSMLGGTAISFGISSGAQFGRVGRGPSWNRSLRVVPNGLCWVFLVPSSVTGCHSLMSIIIIRPDSWVTPCTHYLLSPLGMLSHKYTRDRLGFYYFHLCVVYG